MGRMQEVEATPEALTVRLRCNLDRPCTLLWQVLDPATGAILDEREVPQTAADVNLRIALPPEDGPYRVQVSPVDDPSRLVLIDARILEGKLELDAPRITSASGLRIAR